MNYVSHDIDVCETCYVAYHYGVDGIEFPLDTTTELGPLEKISADYDITDNSQFPEGSRHTVFSKYPCDGCGSLLAGSRWPMVVSEITA